MSTELQRPIRTLVVLPLRDCRASEDVQRAVDRLVGTGGVGSCEAELALLFLAGVKSIVVQDHVRGLNWSFSRAVSRPVKGFSQVEVTSVAPDGLQPCHVLLGAAKGCTRLRSRARFQTTGRC